MDFKLVADYKPFGDQPKAIERLVSNLKNGIKEQTLLGATGTGKTFTIANVIKDGKKMSYVLDSEYKREQESKNPLPQ